MANTIKLNKSDIDALPTPADGKRDTYHFDGVPGLQLRVTSAGIKTFSVFKRVKGGRPERISLGRYPAMTPENAKREALKLIANLVNGVSGATAIRAGKQETTLGDLFKDFLENRRNRRGAYLSEASKRDYKSSFNLHLDKLKNRQLSGIKETDIGTIHTKLGKIHPTRANRVVALMSSLYSYAQDRKLYVGDNPAKGIKKFPENSRDRFLQSDELPQFFRSLAMEQNVTIRDYILLSLLTGARRSNVQSMLWKDVNLERGEWRIPTTKNGTPQTVTLSPEAVQILARRKPLEPSVDENQASYVFPGGGKAGHLTEPRKGWQRILERAGIDNLRMHDLRRTLGSWQAKSGASMVIIGKSLNHKTPSTTAIYARLDLDPVRESVNRATAAMFEAAGKGESRAVLPLKDET